MTCQDVAVSEPASDQQSTLGAARPRRRWTVAAVAAALVAGSVVVGLSLHGGDEFPRRDPEFTTVLPAFSPNNANFSVGLDIKDKGHDVEILEVKAFTSPNVQYLGANAIWPRDLRPGGQPGVGEADWPAGPHSRHSIDTVVPASELDFVPVHFGPGAPGDLFVQAGFRLASGDLGGLNGLKLRYKVGGKTKTKYFSYGVVVCMKPNRCGGVTLAERTAEDYKFYERAYVQLGLVGRLVYRD